MLKRKYIDTYFSWFFGVILVAYIIMWTKVNHFIFIKIVFLLQYKKKLGKVR